MPGNLFFVFSKFFRHFLWSAALAYATWLVILRCAGKAGNPFQTTQGNRLSCRDQEGRRGSEEAVPGPSVFPSGDPGVSGDFWGSQEGCQGPSRPSGRNRGLPLRRRRGQGPHLAKRWEPRGFSRVAAAFSSYDGDLSLPLGLALGSPIFPSGCEGKLGVAGCLKDPRMNRNIIWRTNFLSSH